MNFKHKPAAHVQEFGVNLQDQQPQLQHSQHHQNRYPHRDGP